MRRVGGAHRHFGAEAGGHARAAHAAAARADAKEVVVVRRGVARGSCCGRHGATGEAGWRRGRAGVSTGRAAQALGLYCGARSGKRRRTCGRLRGARACEKQRLRRAQREGEARWWAEGASAPRVIYAEPQGRTGGRAGDGRADGSCARRRTATRQRGEARRRVAGGAARRAPAVLKAVAREARRAAGARQALTLALARLMRLGAGVRVSSPSKCKWRIGRRRSN